MSSAERLDSATPEREIRKISRAAGIVGTLTALSRVFGLIRVQLFSYFFGATLQADAFNAAFSLPNTFRYLLGEGSLTPVVVSVFSRSLNRDSPERTRAVLNASATLLIVLLLVFTALAMALTPFYLRLYVPGFLATPGKFELAVHLTLLLFPQIFFLSIVAFCYGLLNASNHFLMPSVAPIAQNLTVIVLSVLTLWYFEAPIYAYSVLFLISAVVELALQIPPLRARGLLPRISFNFFLPEIREMALLLLPSVFGMAIYQINIFIGKFFASPLPGAISYISYCDLLVQLPLSLFAISVGTAVVPSFSRLADAGNWSELRQTMMTAMKTVMSLIIPSALGLWVLRIPIVSTLFYFGAFRAVDITPTTAVLSLYAIGLPFFACSRILVPSFYALKDTRIPAISAALSLATHIAGCYLLTPFLGAPGITLSLSIASLVNVSLLFLIMDRKIKGFQFTSFFSTIFRTTLAAAVMGGGLALLTWVVEWVQPSFWTEPHFKFARFAALILLLIQGIGIYYIAAKFFRISELDRATQILINRLRSKRPATTQIS